MQDLQRSQNTTEAPVTGKPKGSAVRSHLSLQIVFISWALQERQWEAPSTVHLRQWLKSMSEAENVSQHSEAPNCLSISQLTGISVTSVIP